MSTVALLLATCLVVGVSDGDTLTARCGEPGQYQQVKVRLAAIDAPEARQPYGNRAKQALSDLVFNRSARLDCPKMDRYKRYVCTASVQRDGDWLDAGLDMIHQGYAWHYVDYAKEQTPQARQAYADAHASARQAGRGLWQDKEPVSPWEWRRQRRKS